LRLIEGAVLCRGCCERRRVRWRANTMSRRQRAERRVPLLRAALEGDEPLRLRRSRLEAALRQAEFRVAQRGRPRIIRIIDDPCSEPDFRLPSRPLG
jgi:hypothetical protein